MQGPVKAAKACVKARPHLYDLIARVYGPPSLSRDAYRFLDGYSKSHRRRVTFMQVGASDGLYGDPIRPLIVRDGWGGILIEPLPAVFKLLQRNYRYLNRPNLVFVNAAVSSSNGSLCLWTFEDAFLARLDPLAQLDHSQKSSFDKGHVLGCLARKRSPASPETVLKQVEVPCFTLPEIVRRYWSGPPIQLVVIDAEGHEAAIIKSADLSEFRPEAIWFETCNLGTVKKEVYDFLSQHLYRIIDLRTEYGDVVAVRNDVSV